MRQQENMNAVRYCRFLSNKIALRPEVKSDFQRRRTLEHPLKLDLGKKKLPFILQSSCIYRSPGYRVRRKVRPAANISNRAVPKIAVNSVLQVQRNPKRIAQRTYVYETLTKCHRRDVLRHVIHHPLRYQQDRQCTYNARLRRVRKT